MEGDGAEVSTRGGHLPPSAPTGIAAAAVVVALVLKTVADPDLWGHLAFGRHILTEGLPTYDPFSYTAGDAPWVNHEWLSEVVMYVVFRSAGVTGLVLLKSTMLLCMFAVILAAMRDAGTGIREASLAMLVVAIGGMASFVTMRPQMFTYPIFALFLLAIVRADRGRPRLLWLTPLLTMIGSNLHGGIAACLAVLFLWGGVRLGEALARHLGMLRSGPPETPSGARTVPAVVAVVLLLHVPAALLTPYGLRFWQFVGDTVGSGLPQISEWQRPTLGEVQSVLAVVAVTILAALVALGRGVRRDPLHVVIMALLIAAGLQARRHLPLALIGIAILGAPALVAALRPRTAPSNRRFGPIDAAIATMALAVLVVGIERARCVRIDPATTPQRAVAYLADAQTAGNLIVLFDWGLYAIWNLAPNVRVSMDGRATSLYPPDVLRQHVAFLDATPAWQMALEDADLALLSPRFAVYRKLAEEAGWRLAYEDTTAGVFVRRGSANDERLERTTPPTAGDPVAPCFDGQAPAASASSTAATTARWSDG